jgi:hypothetical protein
MIPTGFWVIHEVQEPKAIRIVIEDGTFVVPAGCRSQA